MMRELKQRTEQMMEELGLTDHAKTLLASCRLAGNRSSPSAWR
jgi:hypothetical protein